jgi:membrane protein YqaA with SNARE-associated domain
MILMWLEYILVFISALVVDISPLPLPPAFTVMIFLQIYFRLPIWPVIIIGVAGSILGRYILTLYIPGISGRIFKQSKNEDVQFLGDKMKTRIWKSQFFILLYTLMPLPSTPLFIAAGMARMKPFYIIPAFIIGKFSSDSVAVFMGKYATENMTSVLNGLLSWKSVIGVVIGMLLLFALLFINWRTLILNKKFKLKFNIWK